LHNEVVFLCRQCYRYGNVEKGEDNIYRCDDCREKNAKAKAKAERKAALIGRHPEVCDECEEPFVAVREWQRFCSDRCRLRAWRRERRLVVAG
jgi:hypothetical protein